MPNWCNNTMEVSGEKNKVELFVQEFTEKWFACIGDYPNIMDENDDGWYDWRMKNWSTKWNICKNDVIQHKYECNTKECVYKVEFDTAWSPPEAFIRHASEKYNVAIELTYREPGVFFFGVLKYDNGDFVNECEFDNFLSIEQECIEAVFGSIENAIEYLKDIEYVELDRFIEKYKNIKKETND